MAGYDYGVGTLRAWGGDLSGGSETLIVSSSNRNECSMCLGNGYICTDVEHVDCDNTNVQCPQCDARATALAKESTSAKIRRLTPVECERLMGWPDDHTRWRVDGTELADSHRYRMCGNGVASPVAQWLGERISEAAR